jgi:hypothetical protein
MKIVVKKENGLLEVGQTYEANFDAIVKRWYVTDVCLTCEKLDSWFKNGYIEEVKEVSYAFEDISSPDLMIDYEFEENRWFPENAKQAHQMQAFAKLTHVRAKILKDKGFENFTMYTDDVFYVIQYSVKFDILEVCSYYYSPVTALLLRFPTKETAELALHHNEEFFKTYLGV